MTARRVFVGLSLLAVATCGASPTAPPAVADNTIVINDPGGQLQSYQTALRSSLGSTLAHIVQALPISGVTVTVTADASQAIGGYGVGGFTPDSRTVRLFIDPAFPGLADVLMDRINPMLAHEFHHAARWRGPGYGSTLLEAMVSEGLADHFSGEQMGTPVPPWSQAFDRAQDAHWLAQARPLFDTAYPHDVWFFGSSPAVPRWVGYTVGYRLVADYLSAHPGASATTLVNTPASTFRPQGLSATVRAPGPAGRSAASESAKQESHPRR